MLKKCFNSLKNSDGYNCKVFSYYYPKQAKDHSCHVHVVGMIFKTAGIAETDAKNKNYKMICKTLGIDHNKKQWAYEILGIKDDAPSEEIKSAHRKLINYWNPKFNLLLSEEEKLISKKMIRDIHEAYQALRSNNKNSSKNKRNIQQTTTVTNLFDIFPIIGLIVLILIPVYLVLVVASLYVLPDIVLENFWPAPQQRPLWAVAIILYIGFLIASLLTGDFSAIKSVYKTIRKFISRNNSSKLIQ